MSENLELIESKLSEIAADLSGYDTDDLSETQSFLELGFDSLFLTQLAAVYQKEFGCKITFRQLIVDNPSISAMATWLEDQGISLQPEPVVAVVEDGAPAPVQTPAIPPAAEQPQQVVTNSMPAATNAAPMSSGLAAVLSEQVALMARQLEMLQQARGNAPATVTQNIEAQISTTQEPSAVVSAPAQVAAKSEQTPSVPAGFGPQTEDVNSGNSLSESEQSHLDRLVCLYNSRTAGSKKATQAYRCVHADPRTAAGFSPIWKEIVYPIVVNKSSGAHLWDIDGNEYVDILNGFGPNFFGHRAPFVLNALKDQLEDGYEVGPQTPLAGEAARLLCEITGMDRVSWVNTGSEAVQAAIRISRTVTGRDKIVVFKGDYHGNFDEVLVRSGGRGRTMPLAPGIPFKSVENVIQLEYGEDSALEAIEQNAHEIAAVLVEPVQSRRPEFQPKKFLKKLRALTETEEIVLVFDEVITGFRIKPGGAQEYFGIEADMATYGKIIGGGMPIGVVAGRAKFMDTFDGGQWQYGDESKPTAGVTFFAGTFVRHPLAIAAAHASLKYIQSAGPSLQENVNRMTTRLATTLNAFFDERGVSCHVAHFASQMFIHMEEESDLAMLFFYHMRAKGIHVLENFPSYITAAHTDVDIDLIINAAKETIFEMQADGVIPAPNGLVEASHWRQEYALTDAQRTLWLASKMDESASCAFNESDSIQIEGNLDVAHFEKAVVDTLNNHEAFRLRFDEDAQGQWNDIDAEINLLHEDLSTVTEVEKGALVQSLLKNAAVTSFDLENGPLFKAILVKLAQEKHIFVLYCHHIVFDGYSASIVIEEIVERYSALWERRAPSIQPTRPYRDFVAKINSTSGDEDFDSAIAYWQGVFSDGVPDLLDLPIDRPREAIRSFDGDTFQYSIDKELLVDLRTASKAMGASLNSTLFSAFGVLMARLSSEEDFVVSVPASGQSFTEIETVGYCVNMLPVRVNANLDLSFDAFTQKNQLAILDGLENQNASFSAITEAVKAPVTEGRLPISEIVFNYSKFFSDLKMPGCKIAAHENRRVANYSDIFFNITESESSLQISWDYRTALYNEETIANWTALYADILREICADVTARIGHLPSAVENLSVAKNFDDGGIIEQAFDRQDATVYAAFSRQAKSHPDKIATIFERSQLSYSELHARVNKACVALAASGARAGHVIGVFLERSDEVIITALAIWKLGGVYLPLDPEFPEDRLRYMIEDSKTKFIFVGNVNHVLSDIDTVRFLPMPEVNALDEVPDDGVPAFIVNPDSMAYILYTSGSSGKPKGVANSHAALMNFLRSMAKRPGISPSDRLLALTTSSFDISLLELYLPICIGASVVVASAEEAIDGYLLADLIREHGVSVVQATPATWRLLLDSEPEVLGGLKALCGGEPMPSGIADDLLQKVSSLWNMYGPTETTVWSTVKKITDARQISVGTAIDNTAIYVLDRTGGPVLLETVGEISIGGAGVALGYLDRSEITAEKFVDDPFLGEGRKMYRTGDWGRMLKNGDLEIVGRRDDQVKIRGHRIELGEIERVIETHEAVRQCVCAVQKDSTNEDLLVAYVIYQDGQSATMSELRQWSRQLLPHYMIPQLCVEILDIPMTNNRKVDRSALPKPSALSVAQPALVAPRTVEEKAVAEIWKDILQTDNISITHNFFELGGQSLKVAQMVVRVRKELGFRIPPQSVVFETLEQLVERRQELPVKSA